MFSLTRVARLIVYLTLHSAIQKLFGPLEGASSVSSTSHSCTSCKTAAIIILTHISQPTRYCSSSVYARAVVACQPVMSYKASVV